MRVAYFDAVGGAAGDMILGALLDAGLSLADLERELARLPVSGYRLRQERVRKHHIAATRFLVDVEGEDHHHHQQDAPEESGHGRSLADIQNLIDHSELPRGVKHTAKRVFRRLGEAEAKVHGVPVAEVHFHEVGAVDSIVDVVGAVLALDLLGLEGIYSSPLPMGSGTIETRHGVYPLPAPATLELAASARAPLISSAIRSEQVTPTGAAILTTLASFAQPSMRIERVGYGAGQADLSIPNVLRVWIGVRDESGPYEGAGAEELCVLETNIDDMNPELYGHVLDRLLQAGALDALVSQVIMKKGRLGAKIEVLCRPGDQQRLVDLLLRETSTLGVRAGRVVRFAAEREMDRVETPYGTLAVKVKRSNGRAVSAVPEFEDCRRLAEASGTPLIDVYQAGVAAGRLLVDDGA